MPAFLYLFGTHVHVLAHAVLLAPEAAALLVRVHPRVVVNVSK